jgi:hypothetical protein
MAGMTSHFLLDARGHLRRARVAHKVARGDVRGAREHRAAREFPPRHSAEKKWHASKKTLTKKSSSFTFRSRKEVPSAMAAKKAKKTTKKSSSKKTTKKGKK